MEGIKILIFGGSFDPPHKIHIMMLRDAIKKIKPQITFIVPTYISPFKKRHLFSYREREGMIKKLIKRYGVRAKICDFEYRNGKKTYTWMVVKEIKSKYPKSKIYFLLGSDAINTIREWKRYDYLRKNLIFVAAKREGVNIRENNQIKLITLPKEYPNISSTLIREKIFIGDFKDLEASIRRLVDKKLNIRNLLRKVRLMMSKDRFNHTLETIKLAIKLSWEYGVDMKKGFLAAALHDVAKDIPIERQIEIIKRSKMRIKDLDHIVKNAPEIIHQWASASLAKTKFRIKDREILSAISKHTTGSKDMSLMDKIIYLSDIAAADRRFKGIESIRRLLFKDIDKAFKKAKEMKIKYVERRKGYVYEI